jgi:hypothetical protein
MRFAGPNALSTRNGRAVVEAANDRDHLGNCEGYLSLNSSRLRRSCAAPESSPCGDRAPYTSRDAQRIEAGNSTVCPVIFDCPIGHRCLPWRWGVNGLLISPLKYRGGIAASSRRTAPYRVGI